MNWPEATRDIVIGFFTLIGILGFFTDTLENCLAILFKRPREEDQE